MTDFKEGDEVYYFIESDVMDYKPLYGISITTGKINSVMPSKIGIINIDYVYSKDLFYKSKNEAIDAMIKRLEAMRDE